MRLRDLQSGPAAVFRYISMILSAARLASLRKALRLSSLASLASAAEPKGRALLQQMRTTSGTLDKLLELPKSKPNTIRIGIGYLSILFCISFVFMSVRVGYSRMLSRYALLTGSLERANDAVAIAPADPESHLTRAAVLHHLGQLPEAKKEYETAVRLRPLDDLLWLELANIRDEMNDAPGAVAALNEAVRAAPYYGHPRWQRGNVLLREGRYDEAFADLRQAAASNKNLQPNLIDLAWGISKFDPKLTEQILQIDDDQTRIRFARMLAQKDRAQEAVEQYRLAHDVPEKQRNEIVSLLIDKKAFNEAFQLWLNNTPSDPAISPDVAMFDGSFEGTLVLDERTFGWRLTPREGINLSADQATQESGAKSLRIDFNGNSDPDGPAAAQLVRGQPLKRYRINFAARTQDIVSGGLPIVTVNDAGSEQLLGKSMAIGQGTNDWQRRSMEFTTGAGTRAIIVGIRREHCTTGPCPIFGILWLDSFSIEELH